MDDKGQTTRGWIWAKNIKQTTTDKAVFDMNSEDSGKGGLSAWATGEGQTFPWAVALGRLRDTRAGRAPHTLRPKAQASRTHGIAQVTLG